jgi:hypothetical protein
LDGSQPECSWSLVAVVEGGDDEQREANGNEKSKGDE